MLTRSEKQIYELLTQGKLPKEIAVITGKQQRNIDKQIEKVYEKLNVNGYRELLIKGNEPFSEPLPKRQYDIFVFVVQGMETKEIALRLYISPRTVETYLSQIYIKFGVRNRRELISRFGATKVECKERQKR